MKVWWVSNVEPTKEQETSIFKDLFPKHVIIINSELSVDELSEISDDTGVIATYGDMNYMARVLEGAGDKPVIYPVMETIDHDISTGRTTERVVRWERLLELTVKTERYDGC